MKKISPYIIPFLITVFTVIPLHGQKHFMLYGYRLGQGIGPLKKELGTPAKVHRFDDGYAAYAWKFADHVLVLETDNTRPDLVWAIQIEGKANPPEMGLEGINLGDTSELVIKKLGRPDSTENAVDESTRERLKDIVYYSYLDSGNFSIEMTAGKVSSIKLQFNGPADTAADDTHALDRFLREVKKGNRYRVASYLATDVRISWKGRTYSPGNSVLGFIMNDRVVSDIFFNPSNGIVSLSPGNIMDNITVFDGKGDRGNVRGFIFTLNQNGRRYQFLMVQGFDGWTVKSISD